MGYATIVMTPDETSNYLTFSKNYRIFKTKDPVSDVIKVEDITDTIEMGQALPANLRRYFSYSVNGDTWSFWTEFEPGNVELVKIIDMTGIKELYFSFKYEYDDGTQNPLPNQVKINEIKLKYSYPDTLAPLDLKEYTAQLSCNDEFCPASVVDRNSSFNPYDTGNAVAIYKEMSYTANQIWGIPCVYFRTVPEVHDGDYIFREWNLFNVVERKCMKIVVNNNEFPDNKLYYNEFGIDFEVPFEVHIDDGYFKSTFNQNSEPRKKDFLYVPMLNRMFEIQGCYLYRGFMMAPVYWRVQLVKFTPNINYLMNAEDTKFLDNLLLDSEETLGAIVKRDTEDVLMKDQYKTISEKFDETRRSLSESLKIEEIQAYYNYAQFLHYYYNLNRFTEGQTAVEYKAPGVFGENLPDMTYSCLFNIQPGATNIEFINAYEDASPASGSGVKIVGSYITVQKKLVIKLVINTTLYQLTVNNVNTSEWLGLIVTASTNYKQVGIFVYHVDPDVNDEINYSEFTLMGSKMFALVPENADAGLNYALKGSKIYIANLRMFNRIISQDDHAFVLQQLFVKDESMLYMIDNCRPRLGAPFVMKKF